MAFQPGESGNPGGRPKRIPKWVARMRKLEERCNATLEEILGAKSSASYRDRIEAMKVVYGYSRGKPRQLIELTGKGGTPLFEPGQLLSKLRSLVEAKRKGGA